MQEISKSYSEAIGLIKSAILKSRYRAAALANKELLSLYYGIGKYISENSRSGFWGTGAIETISQKLQQELPGLRGFSTGNIKRMRIFFEQWFEYIENRTLSTYDLGLLDNQDTTNRTLATHEIQINLLTANRTLPTDEIQLPANFHLFLSTSFTHHYEILTKTISVEERLFYIELCATEFWSVETLQYHLKSNLFAKQGTLPNNFQTTILDKDLQRKALMSFKDEYLLDFVNIESPDEEPDERVLESEIVNNIKKFIMSLGKNFSFIGNQYRMIVEGEE